jgi:hypothetical protein
MYTTEDGVTKHLIKQHQIENPSEVNYSSFVSTKRAKVPVNPFAPATLPLTLSNQVPVPTKTQKLAYKCSMCDKYFRSIDGVSRHLTSFHSV